MAVPKGFEHAGYVAVDSGQLVLCDPSYLKSLWNRECGGPRAPVFVDKVSGVRYYCALHGSPKVKNATPFADFEQLLQVGASKDMTPNECIRTGRWTRLSTGDPAGEFSYQGCCETTEEEPYYGMLKFPKGHCGAGFVFGSGYGDGVYPVYCKKDEDGRIVAVLVRMDVYDEPLMVDPETEPLVAHEA